MIQGVPVDGPEAQDRPRFWGVSMFRRGQPVHLMHYPVLAPGEDLTEQVPHRRISWQEWLDTHADYGLNVDGAQISSP